MDRKDIFPLLSDVCTLTLAILCLNIHYTLGEEKYLAYFAIFYSYVRPLNALLIFHGFVEHSNKEVQKAIRFLSKIAFIAVLFVTASIPITSAASTICANYIYLFDNLLFTLGFSVFVSCIFLVVLITLPNMLSTIFCIGVFTFIYSYWKISGEVYFPLDEAGFFEMLFSSFASIVELLYMVFSYKIVMMHLGEKSDPFKSYINFIAIIAGIWICLAHYRFDIYSADFLISIWLHGSYLKIALILTITFAAIYRIVKAGQKEKGIILYTLALFALSFLADFILYDKSIMPEFCTRHSMHSVSSVLMILLYSTIVKKGAYTKSMLWQIKAYTVGSMLYISTFVLNFGSMSVYIKFASLVLITIGILLFLSISFNNILQIYKSGKRSETI